MNRGMTAKVQWASCDKKTRYGDEHSALRMMREATRQRGTPLHVYSCGICHGWHLAKGRRR